MLARDDVDASLLYYPELILLGKRMVLRLWISGMIVEDVLAEDAVDSCSLRGTDSREERPMDLRRCKMIEAKRSTGVQFVHESEALGKTGVRSL